MAQKKNCLGIVQKRDETVEHDLKGWSAKLKWGLSDVVYPEDGSPSPAAKTSIIIQEVKKASLKKIPSFLIEFEIILLQVSKHSDRCSTL